LAGKVPRVLVTPTNDLGKVLNSVHGISVEGEINLITGIQVAHLALKHRQNKHQRMRIVAFIASPITENESELLRVGLKLKKCNVAMDIISFGSCEDNEIKLESLLATVNKNGNSHLITVEKGQSLADALIATHIFNSSGTAIGSGFAAAAATANINSISGAEDDLGDDPALILALRASLEEERVRQENQLSSTLEAEGNPDSQEPNKGNVMNNEQIPKSEKMVSKDSEFVTSVSTHNPRVELSTILDSDKIEKEEEEKDSFNLIE
jgi:26S proteasome regulatory subunit N10